MSYLSLISHKGKNCAGLVAMKDSYYIYLSDGKDLFFRNCGSKNKDEAEVALGLFLFEYARMKEYQRALETQKVEVGRGCAVRSRLSESRDLKIRFSRKEF